MNLSKPCDIERDGCQRDRPTPESCPRASNALTGTSSWDVHFRNANEFVGTSAGSIVAAHLAKGIEPRAPQEPVHGAQADVTDRDVLMARIDRAIPEWVTALYPITGRATAASTTVGALARGAVLTGLPTGTRSLGSLSQTYLAVLGSRFELRRDHQGGRGSRPQSGKAATRHRSRR